MLSKLEKKIGRYAIKNLTRYLIIGYVVGYVLQLINSEIIYYLMFNPYEIFHGQIWRLFTWVFIPPEELGIFTIIMLILYYQLGTELERTWGTARYNIYMISGFLFTIVGGFVLYAGYGIVYADSWSGPEFWGTIIGFCVSTYYINMSIFLAYAATYPNEQLMLYFILPVRIKWFGWLYGAYIIYHIWQAFRMGAQTGVIITVLIVASLLNFLLYFIFGRNSIPYRPKQVKRRQEFRSSIRQSAPKVYEDGARHKCAICGRTEKDDPNLTFRYCSKCSGGKEYCQEHLFTHTHS